jgi:hypothetical protein
MEKGMTIRTPRGSVVDIRSEPGDDPVAVVEAYEVELHNKSHNIKKRKHPATQDFTLCCDSCLKTARVYNCSGAVIIFSDFGEEGQCPSRQMNVLSLMISGSSG